MPQSSVRSAAHSERFHAAAKLVQRGGPLAAVCGARTRTGSACTQEPLAGGVRCLRHGGPKAAAAHRERQLAGLRTGRVTPEVFARAEARRARNRLLDQWKRNPSLPGSTIDLWPDEDRFQDALDAYGVRSGTDLPAVLDWLRWRFRRCMIDRMDVDEWARAVRDGLPRRLAAAEVAMQWVRLGDHDRRTKAGRAIRAALRIGGEVHAAAVAARLAADAVRGRDSAGPRPVPWSVAVRPWRAGTASTSHKRRRVDPPKAPKSAVLPRHGRSGCPRRSVVGPDEADALIALLHRSGPEVQRLFAGCAQGDEQLQFLTALRDFQRDPDDAKARDRWLGWAQRLRQT